MDIKAYIASGILELYVAGQLSERENREVAQYAEEYPEIMEEILSIESAILEFSSAVSPKTTPPFKRVQDQILKEKAGITIVDIPKKGRGWKSNLGWAASFVLIVGLAYLFDQNQKLGKSLQAAETDLLQMEQRIAERDESLEKSKRLLNSLRDKNILVIPLGGQTIAPESYAKAYWNRDNDQIFIDAQGLPEPPEGMVYQVWSLKLNPLTPTSVGLLEDFINDGNKVFALANPNDSEAFGITLEPAGGSEMPSLEQLYVLGAIPS